MAGTDKSMMGRGNQLYKGKKVEFTKPTQDGAMQYTPGKTYVDRMTFASTQDNAATDAMIKAAKDSKEFKKKLKAQRMVFDSFISSVHSK